MRLIVGPQAQVAANLPAGADLLVLCSPDAPACSPLPTPRRRLELRFNDIDGPRHGLVAPTAGLVAEVLAFGRGCDVLGVGCYAGVSRSTAAAYALACQAAGPGREEDLARALRALSPAATPNPLMVALADIALGRGGRMCRAIADLGRGEEAFEGPLFAWTLDAPATGKLTRANGRRSSGPVSGSPEGDQ